MIILFIGLKSDLKEALATQAVLSESIQEYYADNQNQYIQSYVYVNSIISSDICNQNVGLLFKKCNLNHLGAKLICYER
jgi:hypothetical protein